MHIKILFTILLGLCWAFTSQAQTDPILEDSDLRPLTLSGNIGFTARGYLANGIANRRAPAEILTTAGLNFSVFGLSSGINILYSTDQSSLRQNMNDLSFNTSWRWLTVQAGDVSPGFSKNGINGLRIRGGYIKAAPGDWMVELAGGKSRRRVGVSQKIGFRQPAFERWSFAGKVGYGKEDKNHLYLSSHYSLDKSSSLDSPGSITPQENLTITPDFKVIFWKGLLSLESEITFSAFTRDLNTPTLPLAGTGLPTFLENFMQPHTSSRINYAGEVEANLNLDSFSLGMGYERIQPGYRSLGIGQIRDDHQVISINPVVGLLDNKLKLQSNLSFGRNNLLNTRLQTRRETNVGTNIQFQLNDRITINANHNILINSLSSNAASDTAFQQGFALDQQQVSNTVVLQPNVMIQHNRVTHNFSLAGTFFNFNRTFDNLPTGAGNNEATYNTYAANLSYSLVYPSGLAINAAGNLIINKTDRSDSQTIGGNVGASYALLERALRITFNGGFNQIENQSSPVGGVQSTSNLKSRQIMLNLSANYRLSDKDTFSLTLRSRSNRVLAGGRSNYSEMEGTLNYRRRF